MRRNYRIGILIAACLIAAISLFAADQSGAFLPGWIRWEESRTEGASPGDPEVMVLKGKTLQVLSGKETVWQTERDVLVQSSLWCDINHDGAGELVLLCWKQGRYGGSRPFWVEEDEHSWSQHIFIYQWTGETMRPLWMASDLGMEVEEWAFDETKRLVLTDRTGRVTAWDWRTWGLTNIPLTESQPVQK